jgi:hypothetical protein
MPLSDVPCGWAAGLLLLHGDPLAVELTGVIHGGELDALRRLLDALAGLASVRMIGRKGIAGGWRTALHAAPDWPGHFRAGSRGPAAGAGAGADPNDDCGGDRPETPLHRAASTDDVDVAVVLVDAGPDLETPGGSIGIPLDNAIGAAGRSPVCWWIAAPPSTSCGTRRRHAGSSCGSSNSSPSARTHPMRYRRRSDMPAPAGNDAPPNACSLTGPTSLGSRTMPKARRWMWPACQAPVQTTS